MLCQPRDVGSSLVPNGCANTSSLKWNVPEVLHHCSSFGASSSGKATMGEDIRETCISFIFLRSWIISMVMLQTLRADASFFAERPMG